MQWEQHSVILHFQGKDGEEVLVKKCDDDEDDPTFDITLESEIIGMNSGTYCDSLFVIDAKMRAYETKTQPIYDVLFLE